MPTSKTVVLFEDDPGIAASLRSDFDRVARGQGFRLQIFPLQESSRSPKGPYEDRLVSQLSDDDVFGDIVLLVTDRDLSAAKWGGLSEAAVTSAAETLGLPVACYRQARTTVESRMQRIPGDGKIELPEDPAVRAERIATLARGFVDLERLLVEVRKPAGTGPGMFRRRPAGSAEPVRAVPRAAGTSMRPTLPAYATPGALVAGILGHPDVSTRFDLFACGAQRSIVQILKEDRPDTETLDAATRRQVVAAVGVWLADLVMAYPGILLDASAAASYLDIDPKDFARPEVRALFASARYVDRPFADEAQPMWWRHLFDELLDQKAMLSGRELCAEAGLKRIRFCRCTVDPTLHAGYYCMDLRAPISAEQSTGRVSWFPVGADLARLSKKTFRALAPWMGF